MIISHGSFDIFVSRGASQVLLGVIAMLLLVPLLAPRLRRLVAGPVRQAPDTEPDEMAGPDEPLDQDRDRTQV
jgi:hypothetical protein